MFYTDNCAGLSASTAATASSASSASSTGYKDVGEGYCPQFKELTKGKTQSECFDMVQADSACKNKFYTDNCAGASASSASSTGYKHIGEGYCPQFKELTKGKTQAG